MAYMPISSDALNMISDPLRSRSSLISREEGEGKKHILILSIPRKKGRRLLLPWSLIEQGCRPLEALWIVETSKRLTQLCFGGPSWVSHVSIALPLCFSTLCGFFASSLGRSAAQSWLALPGLALDVSAAVSEFTHTPIDSSTWFANAFQQNDAALQRTARSKLRDKYVHTHWATDDDGRAERTRGKPRSWQKRNQDRFLNWKVEHICYYKDIGGSQARPGHRIMDFLG